MTFFEQALKYFKHGLSVIPIDHKNKKPLIPWKKYQNKKPEEAEIKSWFSTNGDGTKTLAMALVCGVVSGGLLVLDFDVGGFYEAWREAAGKLADDLPVQRTGGGGYQVFFRCPDPGKNDKLAWSVNEDEVTGREVAIETRAKGGYVIVPPSRHPSGGTYEWLKDSPRTIPTISQAQADALLMAARKLDQAPYSKLEMEQARKATKPQRSVDSGSVSIIDEFNSNNDIEDMLLHNGYVKHGKRLIRPGGKSLSVQINCDDNTSYHHSSNDILNNGHRHDPFSVYCHFEHNSDVRAAVKAAAEMLGIKTTQNRSSAAPDKSSGSSFNLTDSGNAKRLVHHFGDVIRYNAEPFKRWFIWNGSCWEPDKTKKFLDYADRTVQKIYIEASKTGNEDRRKELGKWAKASEAATKKKGMLELAEGIQAIVITPDKLDRNPWLFNTLNYTLDLSNGEAEPQDHRQTDYLTKIAPVKYDPDASCPKWKKFLNEIFGCNEELIVFIQRAVGYSLTGDTSEQCLFFCHGNGKNGKTVFFETLKMLFGDYFGKCPTEMIMNQNGNRIPSDVASLKGKRFAVASEVEENKRLAESRVKDLTGGDTIVARKMHNDWFEFEPTHKLWLYGNHKPVIHGVDTGIWRRMKLIPFEVTISEGKRTPMNQLLKTFKKELSGILNWALQGYMTYREQGLSEPGAVKTATEDYRTEMDVTKQFISECCLVDDTISISTNELYDKYKGWCEENGEYVLSSRKFIIKLNEKGFEVKIGHARKRFLQGITKNGD